MKKILLLALAALSVLTGVGSLVFSVSPATYSIFYIFLGVIFGLAAFSVNKERNGALFALALIGLFLTIGLQVIIEGSMIWGVCAIAVAGVIAYKQRAGLTRQYHILAGQPAKHHDQAV